MGAAGDLEVTRTGTAVGVIPARAGSKGVPNKTIAPVAGRPLIAWTIDAALKSAVLDRLVVTTEDECIAAVAREHGAEVPFLRPAELSRDDVPNIEAVLHAVQWLDTHEGYRPEYVVLLQPTSPLCEPEDIRAACNLAREGHLDAVLTVTPVHEHPAWMRRVAEDGTVSPYLPEQRVLPRRQTLAPLFVANGAVFVVRTDVLVKRRTFEPDGTRALVMPPERSLQIDSLWELHVAHVVLQEKLQRTKV